MAILEHQVRPGVYADSIILMQLQSALAARPGIVDAGAVMASAANLELLAANDLLPKSLPELAGDDLLLVVRAESAAAASAALAEVDALMARRRATSAEHFRPRTLESAWTMIPGARWALVSVPGRYAARVAQDVLDAGRNVFLYSDNVALADEARLKKVARDRALLVMGPDCGSAIVGGVGFGFANRVRRGPVGIVAAAGTGLQVVASRLHELGAGVSQALGTGGRDLSVEVGGVTALQALDLLARDDDTRVIILVSKPPAPVVARSLLAAARTAPKPVVVAFSALVPGVERVGNLWFARSLEHAAERAAELATSPPEILRAEGHGGFLSGLFAGGTLALETLRSLAVLLDPIASNLDVAGVDKAGAGGRRGAHLVLDLGADEFTVGRAHPMIDQTLRLERVRREAEEAEVSTILLDVVLGDGAHPDPAAELAPVVSAALERDGLEVVALVVGTDDDPQGLAAQVAALEAAGARVVRRVEDAVAHVVSRLAPAPPELVPVPQSALAASLGAVNVGLEMFAASLAAQEVAVVHVDWRPPAGGNERLAAILEKMR
jgi:FdrA protein